MASQPLWERWEVRPLLSGRHDFCAGAGGYEEFHEGTQVRVRSQDGTVIGVSQLGQGEIVKAGQAQVEGLWVDKITCGFRFEVRDLPDADFYTVTMGSTDRRGEISYSRAELESQDWHVELTI